MAESEGAASGWTWLSGQGRNKAGDAFTCTAFRHATGLAVEIRHDSAHGALFRCAGGQVMRVDRHEAEYLMKREAFLAPHLAETLSHAGGNMLEDSMPQMGEGEWRLGLNRGTSVLTLSFVYPDKSKIQAYLTAKGEFLWYPLKDKVLHAGASAHSIKTRQEGNACLR